MIIVRKRGMVVTNFQQHGSLAWKKSTASGEGGCVEVARVGETTLVRDSKDPSGPALAFTQIEWEAFLVGVHARQFEI
jgi:predicted secreted Zn-dependent protease